MVDPLQLLAAAAATISPLLGEKLRRCRYPRSNAAEEEVIPARSTRSSPSKGSQSRGAEQVRASKRKSAPEGIEERKGKRLEVSSPEDFAGNPDLSGSGRTIPIQHCFEVESTANFLHSESGLIDLLLEFSKETDSRLENVGFLEVLAMKRIHVPPPRWWRPGGYG